MKRFVEALIIAVIVMSLILPQGQKTDVTDIDDSTIVKDSDFLGCQRAAIPIEGMQFTKEMVELRLNPVFEPPAVIPTPPPDVSPM